MTDSFLYRKKKAKQKEMYIKWKCLMLMDLKEKRVEMRLDASVLRVKKAFRKLILLKIVSNLFFRPLLAKITDIANQLHESKGSHFLN